MSATETITVAVNADTSGFQTGIGGVIQKLGGVGPLAIAGAVAGATAAIGKFASDSLAYANEVNDAMIAFQVQTGASADEAAAFSESLRELYRNNTDSVTELGEAASAVTQRFGDQGEGLADVTQEFLNYAKVTGQDTAVAVEKLSEMMTRFNIPLDEAGGLMDTLLVVSQETGAPIDALQSALVRAQPALEDLGMSVEDAAAMFGAAELAGLKMNDMQRAMRRVVQRTNEPTEKQAEAMQALGIEFDDTGNAAGGAGAVLDTLIKKMGEGELSTQELDAAQRLIGTQLVNEFRAAFADGGEAVDALTATLASSEGAVTRASDTYDRSLGERWTLIKRNYMEPFMNFVGVAFIGALEGLMTFIEGMSDTIGEAWNWISEQFNAMFGDIEGDGNSLVDALGAAWAAIEAAVTLVFAALAAAWEHVLKPAWDAIEPLVRGIFGAIVPLIEGAFAIIEGVFTTIAALLEGDFTGAWEAMNRMVQRVNDAIRASIESIWTGIRDFLDGVFGNITSAAVDRWNEVTGGIEAALGGLRAWLERFWGDVQRNLESAWRGIRESVTAAVQGVRDTLEASFDRIKGWLGRFWDGIVRDIDSAWRDIRNSAREGVQNVWDTIQASFDRVKGWLERFWDGITRDMAGAWRDIRAAVTAGIADVRAEIESRWNAIRDWLTDTWELIRGRAQAAWDRVKDSIIAPIQTAWDWLVATWETIRAWLGNLFGGITTDATGSWEGISDAIRAPIQEVWDWLVATWETISGWLNELWSGIGEFASTAFSAVRDTIEGAFEGLGDFVHGIFAGVAAAIGALIDAVVARIQAAWDSVRALGEAVSEAAASAAETATGWRDAANEWAEGIAPEWMRNLPGVRRDDEPEAFALGGIVTAPMRALVGEAGPEAIIPLSRLDRMLHGGGDQTIIVELDGHVLTRAIAPRMFDTVRVRTGVMPT